MFYTHAILTKKGPLAKLWLAAHWDRKLTKTQVFETNIENCCESILEPRIKLALRTKGHLLLGVVRIYSRKVKYLLADCNEAFIKIKMAFRPGAEAELLAEETRDMPVGALTLQENIQDMDNFVMMDLDFDITRLQEQFRQNQARIEDITMKEDEMEISFPVDDDFGESKLFEKFRAAVPESSISILSNSAFDLLERRSEKVDQELKSLEAIPIDTSGEPLMHNGILGPPEELPSLAEPVSIRSVEPPLFEETRAAADLLVTDLSAKEIVAEQPSAVPPDGTTTDQVTLMKNEYDAFVLEPIVVGVPERRAWARRKRRLIVDEVKEIDSATMKEQLADASDTLGILEMAPPTRRLMKWKETGAVEKLFALPCCQLASKKLSSILTDNAVLSKIKSFMLERPSSPEIAKPDAEHEAGVKRLSKRDKRDSLPPKHPKEEVVVNGEIPIEMPSELMQPPEIPVSEYPFPPSVLPPESVPPQEHIIDTGPILISDTDKLVLPEMTDDLSEEIRHIFEKGMTAGLTDDTSTSFLNTIKFVLQRMKSLYFSQLIKAVQMNRKLAAASFFDLLELKKSSVIDVKQVEPYGEILIVRGPSFSAV